MQALVEYERGVHVGGCGLHDSIARDDPDFTLEDTTCPACRAVEVALRVRSQQEHEAEKDKPADQPLAGDGRRTSVRLLSPAEAAELRAQASLPRPANS